MMTIKHITLSGEEFVYAASHVNFVPASVFADPKYAQAASSPPPVDTVWRYDADDRAHPITGGKCYVMNAEGRTVATYTLSDNGPANLAFASAGQRIAA